MKTVSAERDSVNKPMMQTGYADTDTKTNTEMNRGDVSKVNPFLFIWFL